MSFLSSRIEISISNERKPIPDLNGVSFGSIFTDNMFRAECLNGEWTSLKIIPFENISLPPQASIFHYGISIFEGLKAFRDSKGKIRLFRPEVNCQRFASSARRMQLPVPDPEELLSCLKTFIKVEERWVPKERGFSLYIRPAMFGTTASLGVKSCRDAILFVILSPVGPYYPTGFAPVTLYACSHFCRAWIGGTGAFKVGGNYGLTVMPGEEAHERGAQQILWLFGKDEEITEVGSMNFMGIWVNKEGKKELITAGLEEGLILPGVTRSSILELARNETDLVVTEGKWTIKELIEAVKEGRVIELFGTGTAAVISPVNRILYREDEFEIPLNKNDPTAKIGEYALTFLSKLQDIQYGQYGHQWSIEI